MCQYDSVLCWSETQDSCLNVLYLHRNFTERGLESVFRTCLQSVACSERDMFWRWSRTTLFRRVAETYWSSNGTKWCSLLVNRNYAAIWRASFNEKDVSFEPDILAWVCLRFSSKFVFRLRSPKIFGPGQKPTTVAGNAVASVQKSIRK